MNSQKIKMLWITAIVVLFTTAFIGSCKKKDTFVGVTGVCPIVVKTDPVNGATNVPLNQIIKVTFNEKMNPATINQASFTLQGAAKISGTVSYDANNFTMSFVPATPLTDNTTYTGRVATTVRDLNGNALQTDYVWTFSTGATISPMIIDTDPANNDTDVTLNKTVTVDFNIPMDPTTLNASTFTLKQGANSVAGTVSYIGTTASFNPTSNLLSSTKYTATVTTGAKTISGKSIANNYVWTFTTGSTIAPKVISTDPANTAINVVLNKTVTASFSEAMDPLTISATTFTLYQGATQIAGAVSYSGTTASFNPTNNFISGTTYTASITTGAKNLSGISISKNYVWTFTTGTVIAPKVISTDPINNAKGVAYNKIVTATFNMAMDPATITTTSFTLKQGATPVAGTVSYSGTTASFNPTVNLLPATVYTATVTTTAKNVAGIPTASDYTWSFRTLSIITPEVTDTDPTDNETGVVLDKVITATFSQVMDPATITTSTFLLKLGTTSIAGTVSYSNTTATFTPTNKLISASSYTATITSGAKNLTGVALASDYVWNFATKATLGPKAPDLKTVARFGIIAGTAVSNNAGYSKINDMDVGISPGVRSSLTGFPPAAVVNGAIYASDDNASVAAMLTQAKTDLTAAYNYAKGASSPSPATVSGDQGGLTLAPGIYKSTSTLLIQSGDLTLDAKGDANAVWIFQVASGFTTIGGAGGNVILSGGAQAKNIYWQVGSSATIGDNTIFKGNVLALTSITMNSKAVATGRMLAINGAVVMTSTNFIYKP